MIAFVFTLALEAMLASADSAYAHINYPLATTIYETILNREQDNPEVLWRLARVNVAQAEVTQGSEREEHIRAAERYGRRCTEVDSLESAGYTWLAAALGNLAMYEGGKEKVRLANEIKVTLDRALVLNPNDDVAYSILGSFYRALGGVSWIERQLAAVFLGSLPSGGYEESEAALKKAISLAPNVLRHQFELALLYMDWDRPEDAREVLLKASELPILVASDVPTQVRVQEMLKELAPTRQ